MTVPGPSCAGEADDGEGVPERAGSNEPGGGPGGDPGHQELIFKRYAQVKECSIVPRKGHGLGLAGALILARCLGGDINIDSQKGQGAAFRLTLPLKMEDV